MATIRSGSFGSGHIIGTTGDYDYTTLGAWESGQQAAGSDLVSSDEIVQARIKQDLSETSFQVLGWTSTDSTRYLEITHHDNLRHDGTPGSGVSLTASSGRAIYVSQECVHVTGIEIIASGGGSTEQAIFVDYNTTGRTVVDGCIVKAGSGAGSSPGIYVYRDCTAGFTVQNTLVYECDSTGMAVSNDADTVGLVVKHCTFAHNGGYGIQTSAQQAGDLDLYHTVAYGNSSDDFSVASLNAGDYNASEDGTHPSTSNSWTLTGGDPFVDSTNDNYTIAASSELHDAGGSTGAGVEYDCVLTDRPQGTDYDVGWFEVPTAETAVSVSTGSVQFTGTAFTATIPAADVPVAISSANLQYQGNTLTTEALLDFAISTGLIQYTGNPLGVALDVLVSAGSIQYQGNTLTLEKLKDLAISAGSIQFTGGTLLSEITLSLATGTIHFQGTSFTAVPVTEGLVEVSLDAAAMRYTGGTIEGAIELLISSGAIRFSGNTLTTEGLRDVSVSTGAMHYTGNTVTLEKLKDLAISSGAIQFNGQTLTTEALKEISVSSGTMHYQGTSFTPTVAEVLAAIQTGTIHFAGGTFTILAGVAGSSGVRRLEYSQYVHAEFGETLNDLLQRELGEPVAERPKELVEQLQTVREQARGRLAEVQEELESFDEDLRFIEQRLEEQEIDLQQAMLARQRIEQERRARDAVRHDLESLLYRIRWYLSLLEEDEIILLALLNQ